MNIRSRQRFVLLRILCVIVMMGYIHGASAIEVPTDVEIEEITSNWVCKWCPYPDKSESSGEVAAGVGYISNDSYKNGDYTGLDEKGVYPIGEIEYKYRSPQNSTVDVVGAELGTDSRQLTLSGRDGGSLQGEFSYSELPKLNLDTARTPYSGSAHQQLPTGWVDGTDTQNMSQLSNALHDVDVYTNRKTYKLSASYQQSPVVSYGLTFQRDTKEGRRTAGLAFGGSYAQARSAILAIPVDYVTDQGELKINYANQQWQAAVSYQFSSFNNGEKSVRWDNAFNPPSLASVSGGLAALEPDNTMQKIVFTSSYNHSKSTTSNVFVAFGQLRQDDSYLPYTVGGSLPVGSLDGKINTADATINFISRINEQFRLEARYSYADQDNDTTRNTYDYIVADTQPGTPRANFPYSFRKVQYHLLGRYHLPDQELALGINREVYDRTYQEVDTTTEDILKASYRTGFFKDIELQIRGSRGQRDGDKFEPVTEITPAENPLMRKFNLADRDRDQLGVSVAYAPQPEWQLSAYFDAYKDLYSNSDVGLLESIERDYILALQYQFSSALSFNIDYSITEIESTQAGSVSFSTATWRAVNEDQIDVIHIGVNYEIIPQKFSMGMEYSYAQSEGKIKVSTDAPLPKLTSERHTILLYGDYRLDKQSTLNAFYRYEDYDESDWATDGVNPDTIANVLSLGETSPSYRIGIVGVAYRYSF